MSDDREQLSIEDILISIRDKILSENDVVETFPTIQVTADNVTLVEKIDDVLELTEDMVINDIRNYSENDSSKGVSSTNIFSDSQRQETNLGKINVTLEEIVREILKPLIRDWLNQNLPQMINNIIKKEIK
ncbi:MAG: DUF2497 domain-containing protein [Rhodospirillaceae bacterium]|jgi:cell pole-organizing protein PopZ|nr:DUF2497 domain-containing protein [Rhodospirillaceae bacterium]